MVNPVRVHAYRRKPSRVPHVARHASAAAPGLTLQEAIDEVRAGHMGGYTWTVGFKFDIDDPVSVQRVYDKLGDRTMYAIATTNRTLEEWEGPEMFSVRIGHNEGVGLWRDPATGQVFVDNIVLLFGPKVSEQWALDFARRHSQKSVLKVDGKTRTFEFLEVQ